jgi:site-specific DNA-methyltransferase (adenine-specific)
MLQKLLSDKIPSTVLYFDKPLANREHPTMKPIELMALLINNSSRKNEIVLDLFGGSGSTLIACEQLGRKCFMMELDPQYVDVIVRRFIRLRGNAERVFRIVGGERIKIDEDF